MVLLVIKKLSEKNANCGSCVLDQFSSTRTGVWELTDSAFETCVDVLDPNLKIDFKVPPFVQEILDTLDKLVNAVQNVVEKCPLSLMHSKLNPSTSCAVQAAVKQSPTLLKF